MKYLCYITYCSSVNLTTGIGFHEIVYPPFHADEVDLPAVILWNPFLIH